MAPSKYHLTEGFTKAQVEEVRAVTATLDDAPPAVTLAAGMFAGANAGKIAVVARLACEGDSGGNEKLEWEIHPLGFAAGLSSQRYYVGAIAGNLGLFLGMSVMLYAICFLLSHKNRSPFAEAAAGLKHPGVLIVPLLFVMPGTCLAAANVALHGDDWSSSILGIVTIAGCISVPLVLHVKALSPAAFKAEIGPDTSLDELKTSPCRRAVSLFMFGRFVWVDSVKFAEVHFVERWGPTFDAFSKGRQWWVQAELATALGVSVLSAWHPGAGGGCHVRNGLVCLLYGLLVFGVVALRPYISPFEYLTSGGVTVLTFVAVVLVEIGIIAGDKEAGAIADAAAAVLLLATVVVTVKLIYDVITQLYEFTMHRKRDVRKESLQKAYRRSPADPGPLSTMAETPRASLLEGLVPVVGQFPESGDDVSARADEPVSPGSFGQPMVTPRVHTPRARRSPLPWPADGETSPRARRRNSPPLRAHDMSLSAAPPGMRRVPHRPRGRARHSASRDSLAQSYSPGNLGRPRRLDSTPPTPATPEGLMGVSKRPSVASMNVHGRRGRGGHRRSASADSEEHRI